MDGEKDHTRTEGTEERKKPSTIAEGVGNLVESVTHLVKETASVVVDHIKSPAAVSNRVETAVPKVEENYDAPPMTADELAAHAAADHQPSEAAPRATPMGIEVIGTSDAPHPLAEPKKPRSKRRARPESNSSRLTNLLGKPATPKKVESAKSRKVAKKAAKKSKKKTATKKAVKKAKPNKKPVRTAKASTSKKAPKKKRASKK
jgi:hypothetical protein